MTTTPALPGTINPADAILQQQGLDVVPLMNDCGDCFTKEKMTTTTTTPTTIKHVETALLSSLADLQVRNEVDACLQSILISVEATSYLEQQLELQGAKQQLAQTQAEHRATVLEAHAERLERYSRRIKLADEMVVDVAKLTREMQQLLDWKEEHEYKVRNYDAVLAKLTQTEEELKAANRVSHGGEPKPRQASTPVATAQSLPPSIVEESPKEADQDTLSLMAQASVPEEAAPEQTPETTTEPFSEGGTTNTVTEEEDDNKVMAPIASQQEEGGSPSSVQLETEGESAGETLKAAIAAEAIPPVTSEVPPDEAEEDQKPPAVELIVEEPVVAQTTKKKDAEGSANLMALDVEPLMEIFGFLDPMDILNTAQINLKMYTKVDNIFGISEDGQSPPVPTPQVAAATQTLTSTSTPVKSAAAPAKPTPIPFTSTSTTKSPPMGPQGTKATTPQGSLNSVTGAALGKGILSMLQPAKPAAPATPASTSARGGAGGGGGSQPLNAKVAQSMASKLSDAELAAIISMTDKLSKLEKEVHLLRNEKELISAKLEGTENVKQYLINKVKDVEVKLQRSKEDEVKVTQQIASDQEVIAFLDSRVQELEQQTVDLTKDSSIVQAELDTLKVSSSKKITMLSDMLKYEREKLREDESEWKATKKLLVKEVKSCRAQIFTLQAERDGLKGQNEMLNRAINLTSNGSSNRSPGRSRRKNT